MESNERDQMVDDNQRGQNSKPQWQSNGNGVSQTNQRTDDGVETAEDDVRREWAPDNEVPEPIQSTLPSSDENEDETDYEDRTDRDQLQNLQTPQSSHSEDEQENAADEIRTDFAGDGFRRESNPGNNGRDKQPHSDENRSETEEDYRADRDQRQDFQTPPTDHPEYDRPSNPLSDQYTNEANEEIPFRTDNPNELPDQDQNHGFRVPVSDDEETV